MHKHYNCSWVKKTKTLKIKTTVLEIKKYGKWKTHEISATDRLWWDNYMVEQEGEKKYAKAMNENQGQANT